MDYSNEVGMLEVNDELVHIKVSHVYDIAIVLKCECERQEGEKNGSLRHTP